MLLLPNMIEGVGIHMSNKQGDIMRSYLKDRNSKAGKNQAQENLLYPNELGIKLKHKYNKTVINKYVSQIF